MVHIITDEQTYRDHYEFIFSDAFEKGLITFGPNGSTELLQFKKNPDHSINKNTFSRPTTVRAAVMDFLVLSQVEHVAWTRNSTVTHFAKYLRHRYHKEEVSGVPDAPLYTSETTIGNYPEHQPTSRFKQDLRDLSLRAEGLLINPEDFQLPPVLANVLNFLSDHHLEQIYNALYEKLVSDGEPKWLPGCEVGNMLYAASRAAMLNRKKWVATCANLPDTNRFHWMKALIRYRLRNYSIRTAKQWCVEIDDTKDAYVYLTPVPGSSCQVEVAHTENALGDVKPPTKKARLNDWY